MGFFPQATELCAFTAFCYNRVVIVLQKKSRLFVPYYGIGTFHMWLLQPQYMIQFTYSIYYCWECLYKKL